MKLSNLSSVGFDSAARVRAWMQQAPGSVLLAMRRLLPQSCTLCGIASGDALLCIACSAALPSLVCACPRLRAAGASRVGLRRVPRPAAAVRRRDRGVGLCVPGRPSGARVQVRRPARPGRAVRARVGRRHRATRARRRPMPSSRCRFRLRVSASAASTRRARSPGAWRKRIGRPLVPGLARTRDSPPQAALAWADRARNVRGAFAGEPLARGPAHRDRRRRDDDRRHARRRRARGATRRRARGRGVGRGAHAASGGG